MHRAQTNRKTGLNMNCVFSMYGQQHIHYIFSPGCLNVKAKYQHLNMIIEYKREGGGGSNVLTQRLNV
jgi:hypothetical protein